MFLVGLSGNIACGKSTVSRIFSQKYGIYIIDADKLARKVVEPNRLGWKRIRKIFGSEVLNEDHTINRDKLGSIIFANVALRRKLNSCTHDLIIIEIIKELFLCLLKGYHYVILDVPLLFETKLLLPFVSFTIVVYCDETQQLERLLRRNPSLTREEALNRLHSQLKIEEKMKQANFVIDSSTSMASTEAQVLILHETFNKSKKYLKIRLFLLSFAILLTSGLIYAFNKIF